MNALSRMIYEACRCKKCGSLPDECDCHLPMFAIKALAGHIAGDLDDYLMSQYPQIMRQSKGFRISLKNHLQATAETVLTDVFRAKHDQIAKPKRGEPLCESSTGSS